MRMEIPPEIKHLITTGHLMASERKALGFLPQMMCSKCEEKPVDLIWQHQPVDPTKIKKIPGMVWGQDIAVICPCCSVMGMQGKCPHSQDKKIL